MKNTFVFLLTFVIVSCGSSTKEEHNEEQTQEAPSVKITDLLGAWDATVETGTTTMRLTAIVTEGYFSAVAYSMIDSTFHFTTGGQWKLEDGKIVNTYEFDTRDPSLVGKTESFAFTLVDGKLQLAQDNINWTRVDDGSPGDLNGAWLITGRKRDGEISKRTPGPRKTMKILSGTRFQWIAYNTETKEFKGTGGGTYTTNDGKYTENIKFFSRDKSRVGASLEFDYKLEDGDWHHSGFSSKGDPLYEIWSLRE